MKPLPRRIYALCAMALGVVLFVALNIAADSLLTADRLDLTENGLFTLAPGTKHIIAGLPEPVTLKFFYSKKVGTSYAPINTYAKRVRDLLEDYASRSHGRIVLEEIDPEPFTPAEDQANALGLSAAPTDTGDQLYFGLVGTNTIDGKETLPFFSEEREPYLEYDLSSLLYRLSHPKKPVLGVLSSLPLDTGAGGMEAAMQGQAKPFVIYEQLSQTYSTRMIDTHFAALPADIDVLMIVQPGPMTPAQLYAIDQFVLKGGRALVFVDPYSEIAAQSQNPGDAAPTSSSLPSLFRAWGIAFDPTKVVADRALAQAVQTSSDPQNPVTEYPVWLKVGAANVATKDQVTSSLQLLNLASAGALKQAAHATTKFTPLVWSSQQASLLDVSEVKGNPRPEDILAEVNPTGVSYTIAARISGPVHTSFPKGPPLAPADAAHAPRQLMESAGPVNVIVMADTDIFNDMFWVRVENLFGKKLATAIADNGAFVMNAVENLTGSNDLISLRTRATNNRPFTVVQQLQVRAQSQFRAQEETLKQQLTDTESHLHALEQGTGASGEAPKTSAISGEQASEIEHFKRDLAHTRDALRDVQHNLRKDIDSLGAMLAFVNIALMPLLVAGFAIGLAILRRRRRARAIMV